MGNAAFAEVDGLAELGHEITVFTPQYNKSEINLNGQNSKFRTEYIKPILKYGNAAWVPKIIKKLNNFDIIHLHYPFIGGVETFLFKKIKNPLVIRYHMDLGLPKLCSFLTSTYNSLITKKIFEKANRILVSSFDYVENSKLISDFFKKNKEKFIEVPYGVDINKFKPGNKRKDLLEQLNLKEDDKIILFVGGLDRAHCFKGISLLLKAMGNTKLQIINPKLIIVGKGSEKAKYERMVKKLGIEDKVIFADNVDNQELPDYYNLADIFVLPSINNLESFGIVLIEAMACGKPCLASNLPGVRTVVDDTKTGFLVELNNVDNLTEKIKNILENEILTKEMGQAGRKKVEAKYNHKIVINQIDRIYVSLSKK